MISVNRCAHFHEHPEVLHTSVCTCTRTPPLKISNISLEQLKQSIGTQTDSSPPLSPPLTKPHCCSWIHKMCCEIATSKIYLMVNKSTNQYCRLQKMIYKSRDYLVLVLYPLSGILQSTTFPKLGLFPSGGEIVRGIYSSGSFSKS
jgi:hypothetical protein